MAPTGSSQGAKPEELPIERPTVGELVLNLKRATVLGLQLPQTLMARADDMID
jgi:putative ABC transport system substrate-binding protein